MKNILLSVKFRFILFLSLLTGLCCEKRLDIDWVTDPKEIAGKWRWEHTALYDIAAPINPLTPQNTGIEEVIIYNVDRTWSKRQNNILVDTGTYSIGHANRRISSFAVLLIDSIQYYQSGQAINGRVDYYYIIEDSMNFNPGLGGVGPGDSKWYIKE